MAQRILLPHADEHDSTTGSPNDHSLTLLTLELIGCDRFLDQISLASTEARKSVVGGSYDSLKERYQQLFAGFIKFAIGPIHLIAEVCDLVVIYKELL